MTNPLLNFDQLPYFKSIKAKHVIPALKTVLAESRSSIKTLGHIEGANWHNFASEMENIDERIGRVWSPVGHLNAVQDSSELRDAYEQGIKLLTEYSSEVGQDPDLFKQYKTIQESAQFDQLSAAQQKIINNNLLDFRLSGAELGEQDQQRFKDINKQLSELSNRFSRNVLDATQAWQKNIQDPSELAGLPDSALDMAKQLAKQAEQSGWLLNLQAPSFMAVMQHADDTELRKEMYLAYTTRASEFSDDGKFNNAPLIDKILALRKEKTGLLGYKNYAEYSLVKKMAGSSHDVVEFLNELVSYAKPVAEKELIELKTFAQEAGHQGELESWDVSYYSEKLREQRYAFNDEQVKPYLPAPTVFDGLFECAKRLFGISITPNAGIETWHSDVRCFDVRRDNNDGSQAVIGQLYTDLYVRKNKRGGAWMDTCIDRRVKGEQLQIPVAYLTCNFSPPIGDNPALLTHNEVETLFHEFGHTLHHLLTEVDEVGVAGINGVAWDAVELPSQFLENWCWHEQSLNLIAKHYQTGESLPPELLAKMRAAKNFQSGMQTLRQVEFALFDMRLHSEFEPNNDQVQTVLDDVRKQVAVLIPPANNRFQNSFSHIFAGGYAAGYYSYKWSEVLSADAFSRFEEEGIFNTNTGRDFLNAILQRGGVEDQNDLFKEFRGRTPDIQALLQHTGIC